MHASNKSVTQSWKSAPPESAMAHCSAPETLQNEVSVSRFNTTQNTSMRDEEGGHCQLSAQNISRPSRTAEPTPRAAWSERALAAPAQGGSTATQTGFNLSLSVLSQGFEDENISIRNGTPEVAKQVGHLPGRAPQ